MAQSTSTRTRATRQLARSQMLRGLRDDARRLHRRLRRRLPRHLAPAAPAPADPGPSEVEQVEQVEHRVRTYLDRHRVRGLQLGAGRNLFGGWLSTDKAPRHPEVLPMDATGRFPLPDESFDYVYAEHMIEHVGWHRGQQTLAEAWRVLRPGGRIRLATPDLAVLVDLYAGRAGDDGDHYTRWVTRRYLPKGTPRHPVFVLNNAMRNWGHSFLYDEEVLRMSLDRSGFTDVRRQPFGESDDPHLCGLEAHGEAVANDRAVRFETMVLEATRP